MVQEPSGQEGDPSSSRPVRRAKPGGSAGSPTPLWLWGLVLGGFGLIFWYYTPVDRAYVPYSPWLIDQVDRDNIQGIQIRGNEIRGRLRTEVPHTAKSARQTPIRQFVTFAPSADSLESLIRSLREPRPGREPVRIEIHPAGGSSTRWWMLLALIPTLLVVVIILRTIAAGLGR
jgi:cell division protease FtsH